MGFRKLTIGLALAVAFFVAQLSLAAEIHVDLDCALADAIAAANNDLATGGCAAGNGADTIMLSGNVLLVNELPLVKSAVTINGLGKHFISGDNRFRIFFVGAEGKLTLRNLTLARGNAREESAVCGTKPGSAGFGGAVCNMGELIVLDSRFTRNEAARGGAIYSLGRMTVNGGNFIINQSTGDGGAIYLDGGSFRLLGSILRDNESDEGGGALFSLGASASIHDTVIYSNESHDDGGAMRAEGGSVEVHFSTFASNTAADDGGAMRLKDVRLEVSASTFSDNAAADDGGAIHSATGNTRIVNSTFNNNSAEFGGAISSSDEDILLKHVTIVLNSASRDGGGVLIKGESDSIVGRLFVQQSILANNESSDCHVGEHGQMFDNSRSLIADGTCMANTFGDPGLGDLVYPSHGGPAYFPLLPGSLAVDIGDPYLCLEVDQVGTARPQGDGCDLGAIEYAG